MCLTRNVNLEVPQNSCLAFFGKQTENDLPRIYCFGGFAKNVSHLLFLGRQTELDNSIALSISQSIQKS